MLFFLFPKYMIREEKIYFQGDPMDWVSIHRFHHQFTDSDRDPHSPKEGLLFSHILWIFDTQYIKYKVM